MGANSCQIMYNWNMFRTGIVLLLRGASCMFARHTRYLLIFVTSICLSLLLLTMHPSRTLAAANPITVTNQTDTVTFPKSIDFQVSVTDLSSTITGGTVFIKDSNTLYNTPHIVDITTPAHTITLHSYEDISGANFA